MGLKPGDRIGDYVLVRALATTGHSEVWEGCREPGRPNLALKVIAAGKANEHHVRLKQESDILESLSGSYTVQHRTHGRLEDGTSWLAMEYLPGPSLSDLLKGEVIVDHVRWTWMSDLMEAVTWIHRYGVIHRDLKTHNVMRDRTGRLKIIDFDASIYTRPTSGERLTTLGGLAPRTREYKPPESPEDADERYDLFSLGVIFTEIWLKEHPWYRHDLTRVEVNNFVAEPRLWWPKLAGLPAPLALVLKRATAKDPLDRYQSAKDLKAALEACRERLTTPPSTLRSSPLSPPPAGLPAPAPDRRGELRDPFTAEHPLQADHRPTVPALSALPEDPSPRQTPFEPTDILPHSPAAPRSHTLRTTLVMLTASTLGAVGMFTWRTLPTSPPAAALTEPEPPARPTWKARENPFLPIPLPPTPVLLGGPARSDPWEDPPSRAFEPEAAVYSPARPYALQQHEVTWSELGQWCAEHPEEIGCDLTRISAEVAVGHEHRPATGMPQLTALRYCAALQGSLPDEAQWEWAARGNPDGTLRPNPWGSEPLDPQQTRALGWPDGEEVLVDVMSSKQDITPGTGLHDLAGNALEWTADPFRNAAGANAAGSTLQAPLVVKTRLQARGALRPVAVRGLPWLRSQVAEREAKALEAGASVVWRHLRWDGLQPAEAVVTDNPVTRLEGVGFRCVKGG